MKKCNAIARRSKNPHHSYGRNMAVGALIGGLVGALYNTIRSPKTMNVLIQSDPEVLVPGHVSGVAYEAGTLATRVMTGAINGVIAGTAVGLIATSATD